MVCEQEDTPRDSSEVSSNNTAQAGDDRNDDITIDEADEGIAQMKEVEPIIGLVRHEWRRWMVAMTSLTQTIWSHLLPSLLLRIICLSIVFTLLLVESIYTRNQNCIGLMTCPTIR
jgi:hypothetical protein